MTRIPLRPLARILEARAKGQNPDVIEKENIAIRHEAMRDTSRARAEKRLTFLAFAFFVAFSVIGARMGTLAASEAAEPRSAGGGVDITAQRADILDRNGRILATNMLTHSLYAQPRDMVDPVHAATELAAIFPELDAKAMERRFTDGRSFLWVRKVLSPEQMQKVHEIGDPGLYFGPREMRLYPNGTLAAHILGGAAFGAEGVDSAEVIGTAGFEKADDARLRDPATSSTPVKLSIDMTLQANVEEVLSTGMHTLQAKGAAAILMDVHTGEVLAMASLPDFDPNDRPGLAATVDPSDNPLFNRAVQGVYELGSTFKIFAVAQAMDLGLVTPDTLIDTTPMVYDGFRINEFDNHNYGPTKTVSEVIAVSSNIGAARIGLMIGGERQQAFLKTMGLLDPPQIELAEAPSARALVPKNWSGIVTVTASYGHGISTSLMNLAAAYATIGNGGLKITPTLIHSETHKPGPRVITESTAMACVRMMRQVVTNGTATFADVPGYGVAGKTGTAEKPKKNGKGYDHDKVINTFASVFPASDPKYVLIVTLDEPVETAGLKPRRTAGYTAVPVAGEIIRRIGPLVGLRPQIADGGDAALTTVAAKEPVAQE